MKTVRAAKAATIGIIAASLAAFLAGCGAVRSEQGKAGIDDVYFGFGKNGNLTEAKIVSGQEACERRIMAMEKPEGGTKVVYETWSTLGFEGQIARTELGKSIGDNIANLPWDVILKQLPSLGSQTKGKGAENRCSGWAPNGGNK